MSQTDLHRTSARIVLDVFPFREAEVLEAAMDWLRARTTKREFTKASGGKVRIYVQWAPGSEQHRVTVTSFRVGDSDWEAALNLVALAAEVENDPTA